MHLQRQSLVEKFGLVFSQTSRLKKTRAQLLDVGYAMFARGQSDVSNKYALIHVTAVLLARVVSELTVIGDD